MAGRKRAATDDTEKRETRSSKAARTEGSKSAGRAAKGTARLKTSMAQSAFKARAVPLYVSITTTSPAPEGQEDAAADSGFLASTTLVPSTFATGSFGWKGHKRMVVELPHGEGEEEGEKVHVTLTINATVIGSKNVKEGEEHEGAGEHTAEEPSGEAGELKPEAFPAREAKEREDNPPAGDTGDEHTAEESAS